MIDPSPSATDADLLACSPACVRIGAGDRLAVVVVLTSLGLARIRREGVESIGPLALEKAGLGGRASTGIVWRYTAQPLPVLPAQVEAIGALDAVLGRADTRDPLCVATLAHFAEALHQVLHVPADLPWFQGHFPTEPILAGIVQVRWAVDAARILTGRTEGPASVQQLKFKSPIRPESIVDLTLACLDGAVTFAFRSAVGECSYGRLQYRV